MTMASNFIVSNESYERIVSQFKGQLTVSPDLFKVAIKSTLPDTFWYDFEQIKHITIYKYNLRPWSPRIVYIDWPRNPRDVMNFIWEELHLIGKIKSFKALMQFRHSLKMFFYKNLDETTIDDYCVMSEVPFKIDWWIDKFWMLDPALESEKFAIGFRVYRKSVSYWQSGTKSRAQYRSNIWYLTNNDVFNGIGNVVALLPAICDTNRHKSCGCLQ